MSSSRMSPSLVWPLCRFHLLWIKGAPSARLPRGVGEPMRPAGRTSPTPRGDGQDFPDPRVSATPESWHLRRG